MVKVSCVRDVSHRQNIYCMAVDLGVTCNVDDGVPNEQRLVILMQHLLDRVAAEAAAELQKTVK